MNPCRPACKEDPEIFVKALLDSGWLDRDETEGVYKIHDWQEHQGWACGAKKRSEAARKAANLRWDKKLGNATAIRAHDKSDASAMRQQDKGDAPAMRKSKIRNAPSPFPSPSPNPNPKKAFTKVKAPKNRGHFSDRLGDQAKKIISYCQNISKYQHKGNGQRFNPFQWVQFQTNKNMHPAAILETVEAVADQSTWNDIRTSAWSYATAIIKTKNGNWNERDHIAEAEKFKNLWIGPEIQEVIKNIGL